MRGYVFGNYHLANPIMARIRVLIEDRLLVESAL